MTARGAIHHGFGGNIAAARVSFMSQRNPSARTAIAGMYLHAKP